MQYVFVSALGLLPSANVAAADWIKPRLRGFGSGVAAVVPDGFPAYVRILHPVCDARGRQSWADVAARSGCTMHRLAQFHAIARAAVASPAVAPQTGSLPIEQFRALCSILGEHSGTADSCWFCLWEGYGQLHGSTAVMSCSSSDGPPVSPPLPVPPIPAPEALNGPRVRLPFRNYILFEGSLDAAAELPEPFSGSLFSQSPNLFWPHDHAWCVASEIDLFCTLVAGTEALADALETDPRLETWRVDPGDPIAHDSDRINT